ncbi:non-ribosomal peptide synthetase [Apiospora arundinis]
MRPMDALASKLQFLNPGGNAPTPSFERRAVTTSEPSKKTCGYYNGDPNRQRTAEAGFDCRVDVSRGLWGFCTTTVISAGDCNFAGACFDRDACLEGCGKVGYSNMPTMTCPFDDINAAPNIEIESPEPEPKPEPRRKLFGHIDICNFCNQ